MKNLTILKRSQPPRDSFLSRRGTSILLVCALLAVGACSQPSRTGTGADPTPSSPPVETTDGSDGIEVGLVEGTEEWALTSLDELRRESELIVEGTVDGTRLTGGHQSQADPNQRIEQRLLTLTVIDVLRGDVGEGAAIEIYDANLYTEDDRARYLLVYLDAEVRVGDRVIVALVAIVATFVIQVVLQATGSEANSLLIGALTGLAIFLATGAVKWNQADDIFTAGMKMMALIGFIMITAQGFAAVMSATGEVDSLVAASAELFAGSKAAAAVAMLVVGLIVTMGIGSSFSTLPIITTIYVPLCLAMGFSPVATVAIIGTAGALGDAGSPASDSTLGPTAGLNADGQHDHIRDSVIPTFIHFNIPLLISGFIAAMVL